MKKENFLKRNKVYVLYGFVFIMFCVFMILMNATIVFVADEIQNINYAKQLSNNMVDKNLTYPYPDFDDSLVLRESYNKNQYVMELFNKSVDDYMVDIQNNYYYSEDYDCKYWAFIHTIYWIAVKDEYDYKLKYVTTENHIFVMLYNESGYCVLDGNDYKCLMRVRI